MSVTHWDRWDRLRIFTFLWAFAFYFHAAVQAINILHPASLFVLVITALVLWRSNLLLFFIALVITQLFEFFIRTPQLSNHWLVVTLLDFHIAVVIIRQLVLKEIDRDQLYDQIAAGGRVLVIILFFWATFHKLNHDFIASDSSCSITVFNGIFANFGLGQYAILNPLLIHGTLLIEAGIPLLLLFRRTRAFGILVGLGFHFVLGIGGFQDFGGVLYAMYFLFTAPNFVPAMQARHKTLFQWLKQYRRWLHLGMIILLLLPLRWFVFPFPAERLAILWAILAGFVIYIYVTTILNEAPNYRETSRAIHQPLTVSSVLVLLVAIINGFLPYTGLKTNLSFDMYSNLQTENGQSNHLLIPASWQIFDYTRDFAIILETEDALLRELQINNQAITRFELRRYMMTRGGQTTVRYQDEIYTLPQDNAILGHYPLWMMKVLTFDPIDQDEIIQCSW